MCMLLIRPKKVLLFPEIGRERERERERERNRQKRKQTKEEIRTSLENLMGYVNFSFMLYEFNVGYVQREKYSICYTTTSSSSSSNLYL